MKQETENPPELFFPQLDEAERLELIAMLKNELEDEDYILSESELKIVNLSEERAEEITRKLLNSLDRTNFSASVIKFATQGFVAVLAAMLKPALSAGASQPGHSRTGERQ